MLEKGAGQFDYSNSKGKTPLSYFLESFAEEYESFALLDKAFLQKHILPQEGYYSFDVLLKRRQQYGRILQKLLKTADLEKALKPYPQDITKKVKQMVEYGLAILPYDETD